ncbi:MAG: type II toxin-antitoxin system VapC family toxin [Candidatus Micrarchaeia archaeon]|jgi:predicted nucleic acid-binding protein
MYIYDSSAFYELIKTKDLNTENFILDLTFYEVGNILWKYCTLLKKKTEFCKKDLENICNILENWERVIRIYPLDTQYILEIAIKNKLTFYDAAYIYLAKKYSTGLLTCDKKLYVASKKEKIKSVLIEPKN